MSKSVSVAKKDRPLTSMHDWFEPGRFFRLLGSQQPLVEMIKVEEEVVKDKLVVRAELPGLDPDKDVEITMEDDVLTIRAERRHESTSSDDGAFRTEFDYGSFQRVLRLPKGITAKDVSANYADGILEVKVPMPTHDTKTEKIAISRK